MTLLIMVSSSSLPNGPSLLVRGGFRRNRMRNGYRCQGPLWPNRLLDAAFNGAHKVEQCRLRFSEDRPRAMVRFGMKIARIVARDSLSRFNRNPRSPYCRKQRYHSEPGQ